MGGAGDIQFTSATPEIGGISHVGIILMDFANTPADKRFDANDESTILNFIFDDTEGAQSVHNLFQEMSYGVDGFTGEIVGTYEISWNYFSPCPGTTDLGIYLDWNFEALDSAAAEGTVINPGDYDLLVFMTPSGGTCDGPWAAPNGVAYRMASWPVDIPQVSIFNWDVPTTTAHEIGHIRGFGHSGVTGVNAYADLSCVMGDNYDYAAPVTALPMRQVGAYWKNYAGYFLTEDVYELTDAGGTHTVYLAPSERASADIVDPTGETAYQLVKVNSVNQSTPYYLSFRSSDPAFTDFDDDPAFAALMDRTHVHTASGDTWRRALLEAGQSYEGENFMVTAVNDGLTGDPYIELTVVMYDKLAPELAMDPELQLTNNSSAGVAPETYTLTVTNIDPAHIDPTTFDFSGSGTPDLFTVDFSPTQLTLAPGESGSVTVSLNFTSQPVEDGYVVSISVSDPVGPRSDAITGAMYLVDHTPPTDPTGLTGGAGNTVATLSWNPSEDYYSWISPIVYHVERNGVIVGTTEESEYVDDGLAPNTTYEYRVMAYDGAGNPSGWSNLLTLTTDCAHGFTAEFSPSVLYRNTPLAKPTAVPGRFDMTITNHNHSTCSPVQYSVTGTCSATNYFFNAPQPVLEGGETVEDEAILAWFVQPWVPPANGIVTIDVVVDDDDPGIPPQTFELTYVYDTVVPTAPANLTAASSPFDQVTLNWDAANDATSGVAYYEIQRNGVIVGTTSDLTYVDNVDTFQALLYYVRAVDNAGNTGPWSNRAKAGCPGCPRPIEI
jgi:hypothetical protein